MSDLELILHQTLRRCLEESMNGSLVIILCMETVADMIDVGGENVTLMAIAVLSTSKRYSACGLMTHSFTFDGTLI